VLNDARHLFLHAAAQDDSNNLPGEVYRRRGGLNGLRPINIVLIACFNYGRPKFTISAEGSWIFFPKQRGLSALASACRPAPDALSGTGVLLRRDRQGDPVVIMQEPRSNAMRVGELACQLVDHTRFEPAHRSRHGAAARTSAARFPSRPSRTEKSWQDVATPHLTQASRKADCAARYRPELWTRP